MYIWPNYQIIASMTEIFSPASKFFIDLFGQVSHILGIIICKFVVFTGIKYDILKCIE